MQKWQYPIYKGTFKGRDRLDIVAELKVQFTTLFESGKRRYLSYFYKIKVSN